jgi:hypothetical protein
VTEPDFPAMAASTTDFNFLQGSFDVRAERLRDPFDPGSGWIRSDATATATARTHFAGAVSLDELWFAAERRFALAIRLFDPAARQWTVYGVTSDTGQLRAPVTGAWADGQCVLTGAGEYRGRPLLTRHTWSDVTGPSAHWEQSFSVDDGATWQPNAALDYVRRPQDPATQTATQTGARLADDFDFEAGTWRVRHRRLSDPLGTAGQWTEFESVQKAWTYCDGAVSVDEVSLPDGRRGLTVRTFDPATRQWSIYWVNSASGQLTPPPVVGGFVDGVGTFLAREEIGGQLVDVRFLWSGTATDSPHWEQAFSADDGQTWRPNWEMDFTRVAAC